MDAKTQLNLGLNLLGSYSVNSIAPATTPLEKKCATFYTQWRDSELTKNRWVFARGYAVLSEGGGAFETAERPYSFALPSDCLRPLREKSVTWEQRGRYLYNATATLTLNYLMRVVEANFDPLFVDVLAARIAVEMCESVTQSNLKKADARAGYKDALKIAKAANAVIIGMGDDADESDEDDEWIAGRRGVGL